MALTKHDIVEQIQAGFGLPKKPSIENTEILLECVNAPFASGDDILVSRPGKFCLKEKKERNGRNPATGEDAMLPAGRVLTFKCSDSLGDMVNVK